MLWLAVKVGNFLFGKRHPEYWAEVQRRYAKIREMEKRR